MSQPISLSSNTSPATKSRVPSAVLWILQVVAAGIFLTGAAAKLFDPVAAESFGQFGFGEWFRYFIAGCEFAGAVGLLIPILTGLASIALVALMIGATIVQATVFHGDMVAYPAATLVLVAVIAWGRRDSLCRLKRFATRRS